MSAPNPSATSASAEKPVLLEAIDLTIRTIDDRVRAYQKTAITAGLMFIASIAAALAFRRAWPVTGLILVVPLSGGFLFLDSFRVARWRTEILDCCLRRKLELPQFLATIAQLKYLPQASLRSMLATLPPEASGTAAAVKAHAFFLSKEQWKILKFTAALFVFFVVLVAACLRLFGGR
jgi:hypothetical protein